MVKSFLKRNPILGYFLIAFLISWGGTLLGGLGKFIRKEMLSPVDVIPMGIGMLLGPSAAGLIMTRLEQGKEGVSFLLSGIKDYKFGLVWYMAILIFPVLILVVLIALSNWVTPELRPTFFPIGILMGGFAGFTEEIGWTGYAHKKMRQKRAPFPLAIILGAVHAFWHMLADFLGNFHNFGANWFLYFIGFFMFVIALRIFIVWAFESTGSLLLAQLIHISSTAFLSILVPMQNSPATWPIFYGVYAPVLWLAAGLVVLKNRKLFFSS